jgi:hypothetical protein
MRSLPNARRARKLDWVQPASAADRKISMISPRLRLASHHGPRKIAGMGTANDRESGKKRDLNAKRGILCNFADIV